jgi:hypothetical protein
MLLRARFLSSLQPGTGRGDRALLALAVWGGALLLGAAAAPLSAPATTVGARAPADTSVTAPDTAAAAPPPSALPLTYDAQLRATRALERRPDATQALALGGLVVDETVTPRGRTFYGVFFGGWRSPSTAGFYTVRIEERPTPGRGTLVQVFVNDDVTFRTRLQPQSPIDDLALQAARRTYSYVQSGRGQLTIY